MTEQEKKDLLEMLTANMLHETTDTAAITCEEMERISGGSAMEGHLDENDKRNLREAVKYVKKGTIGLDNYLNFCRTQGMTEEALQYVRYAWANL